MQHFLPPQRTEVKIRAEARRVLRQSGGQEKLYARRPQKLERVCPGDERSGDEGWGIDR